jgi:hypothetical protein
MTQLAALPPRAPFPCWAPSPARVPSPGRGASPGCALSPARVASPGCALLSCLWQPALRTPGPTTPPRSVVVVATSTSADRSGAGL